MGAGGYSASTTDQMSSALDFTQHFGGIDKSSKGIGKNELIIGGITIALVLFLALKKGK